MDEASDLLELAAAFGKCPYASPVGIRAFARKVAKVVSEMQRDLEGQKQIAVALAVRCQLQSDLLGRAAERKQVES